MGLKVCMAIGLVALFTLFFPVPQDKVVFLDVGQGDATLYQQGIHQVLIDGGQTPIVLQRLGEELPWFDRTIDVMIVTHPQRDHLEGLLYVLNHYRVGLVLLPQVAYGSQLQREWLQMLQDRHQAYRFAWQGQRVTMTDMDIQILAPFDTQEWRVAALNQANNASVTTRIAFHDRVFLSYGDGESWLEDHLIAATVPSLLKADVLKAGHHGSKTSTGLAILAAVVPKAVVIAVGAHNSYGHPSQIVLDRLRGIPVFRTDRMGSIRFLYNQGRWVAACWQANLLWSANSCMKNI